MYITFKQLTMSKIEDHVQYNQKYLRNSFGFLKMKFRFYSSLNDVYVFSFA